MNSQLFKSICKKSRAPFFAFLVLLITIPACQSGEQKPRPFEPVFDGLSGGHFNAANDCITINNYSVRIEFKDIEQELKVFDVAGCLKKKPVFSKNITVDTMFSGIWMGYVVLDEGTDVNSRELHLIQINKPSEVHHFSYELHPVFKQNTLIYYVPLEKKAKQANCGPAHIKEFKEWQKAGLGIELAQKYTFDLKTKKSTATNDIKCFPLQ